MSNVAVWNGPHLRASNEGLLRPRVARVQKTLPGYLRDPLSTFYLGGCPMSVLLRPSNEVTDDPSKLARSLFRDGG